LFTKKYHFVVTNNHINVATLPHKTTQQ